MQENYYSLDTAPLTKDRSDNQAPSGAAALQSETSSPSAPLMGHGATAKVSRWHGILQNRWVVFAASTWMEACAGTGYMFGIYSQSFKTSLGYNQKMVDGVGMAKDIGGNVGITSGFVGDYAPTWVVLLVGALQNVFGHGILWLALTGRIPKPSFWQICIIMCIGTNGGTFFNTGALVTCVKSFPSSRGPVVGLLKGYIGLGGAIFTQAYLALYAPDRDSFLLMASWLPALVACLVMPLIHPLPPVEEAAERGNFLLVLASGISLAFYLLGASLLDEAFVVGNSVSSAISVGAVIILALPLIIGVKQEWERNRGGGDGVMEPLIRGQITESIPRIERTPIPPVAGILSRRRTQDVLPPEDDRPALLGSNVVVGRGLKMRPRLGHSSTQQMSALLKDEEEPLLDEEKRASRVPAERPFAGRPRRGEDHNLLQSFCTADFWLIYLSMTLAAGSGLTAINNLGQIGRSLGYEQDAINVFVSLMSIWNFLGRVGGGFISESFVRDRGVPRPLFMVVTQAVMSIGHLFVAAAFPGSLYIGSALIGLTYGAQWGIMPAVASEVFGLRYFSTLYNWLTITNPTGSYFLSVCVAGYLYDIEAEKDRDMIPPSSASAPPPPDGGQALLCNGAHCFRVTFIVMAGACIVASVTSLCLTLLCRSYYLSEFVKKQHGEIKTSESSEAKFDEVGRAIPSIFLARDQDSEDRSDR